MQRTEAKLWYLKKIDLFSSLPDEEIERLSEMMQMEQVSENRPIYFPGESADTVYVLKSGRVRLSRISEEGRQLTLAILEPGEIFGVSTLIDESEHVKKAETMRESFLCALGKNRFLKFVRNYPELNLSITKMIGNRSHRIESKLEDLVFLDARHRLASVLLDLFEHHGEKNTDEDRPRISFTHQELADLTGVTRSTVTRVLNTFKQKGWIELGSREIILSDPGSLKSIGKTSS